MPPPLQSEIWIYFELNEHDTDKAQCKICRKNYSRKGRTTSSLKNHLRSMHPIEFASLESSNKTKQLQQIKIEPGSIFSECLQPELNIEYEMVTPSQDAKEQLSFKEIVLKEEKCDTNDCNSKKIDKLIGEMITLQNLPFNFVEGLGFRRLIQELAPGYNLRGSYYFSDIVCKELYGKIAKKVKELIVTFNYMSFTSDIWSDASLLTLTCHGIDENFNRSLNILKCETFDDHLTGDIITEKFSKMLSEWNIKKEHVHCLIRDEGSNMKRDTRLTEFNDMDCTVHKMQLAVRSCLHSQENIKIVKQKCKKISTHFSHSTIAQKQLQNIQERMNQCHLKVFQDCITRWNSTLYMFERFLKVKDALSVYINDSDTRIDPILPEEWKIIECCIELLKPFEEATRQLTCSQALISSVIPIIQMLDKKLDDYLTRSHDYDPIRQAATTLKTELSTKFSTLMQENNFVIATYLDPRYKHKFSTALTEKKIKEEILRYFKINTTEEVLSGLNCAGTKRMKMTDPLKTDIEQPGTSGTVRKLCLQNYLAMMLDSSSEDEDQDTQENGSTDGAIRKELLCYRNKKRININANPLKWWSVHQQELKMLSTVARRFLSAPAASVPSEQLARSTDLIYEPLQNRLEPEKAAMLFFIKYNAPIFDFKY